MVIDVLPDMKPVYAVLDCGTTKLPCNFEFLLCENSELTVLLSSSHRFPAKAKNKLHFEREKTFFIEYLPPEECKTPGAMAQSFIAADQPRERKQCVHFNKHL